MQMLSGKQKQRGQAVVEFTLVMFIFFMLVFSIVEFSHLFYVRLTLRHALANAGRFTVTGRTLKDASDKHDLPREAAIRKVLDSWLIGTGVGLEELLITCGAGNACTGGKADDTVTLTARLNKPLFTAYFANFFGGFNGCPKGHVCFTMRTTWKNEPFPS